MKQKLALLFCSFISLTPLISKSEGSLSCGMHTKHYLESVEFAYKEANRDLKELLKVNPKELNQYDQKMASLASDLYTVKTSSWFVDYFFKKASDLKITKKEISKSNNCYYEEMVLVINKRLGKDVETMKNFNDLMRCKHQTEG